MSRQIAGFITEWDANGRFRVTYPRVRDGVDSYNTESQLATYAKTQDPNGWSPAKKKSYLAKAATDKRGNLTCFAYLAGKRVTDFSKLVQQMAVFEVDFLPFAGDDAGWWIRVASVRA